MSTPISRSSAPQYQWAKVCDGWRLASTAELSVIEERVPPGAGEVRHYHEKARQFFYVLGGRATLEVEGEIHTLAAGVGLEIAPAARHRFMNRSDADVVFLVISAPSTQGDRIDVD